MTVVPTGSRDDRQVLAVNAGSSTVKAALFSFAPEPHELARVAIDGAGRASDAALLTWADAHLGGAHLAVVGHRIVHGGPAFAEPQHISAAVYEQLHQLVAFAPNHLPDELALVDACRGRWPSALQIACFDTAFHHGMPERARRLPIAARYDARGVRRYGFHGLSYAYLMEELARVAGPDVAGGRVVLAHLGNGSSLAAVSAGRSIDTTMAFTPIGGVVMGTRSGDLDPGVVTYLARADRLSPDDVEDLLSKSSGLLGVSGATSDMRALLAAADPAARLAVEIYAYSVRKAIGAFAAALGGIDTLVFSGGIGEHAASVRAAICEPLGFLGIELDAARNQTNAPVISRHIPPRSGVEVRVIPTDEELMIARAAYRLLATS